MKHYDYVEWVLYKNKLLDDEIYKEMEEHLLQCNDCMDIFLSLIDEIDLENAKTIIPIDFTDKVIKNIKNIRPITKPIRKKKANNFFMYYVAVASITILLTAGGFFEKMIDTVPHISVDLSEEANKINTNAIYNFSEKITSKTSKFINNFQFKKVKED